MAETVMVATLLVMVMAGIVQVGLVMHVRNVLAAAAAEGARYAAVSGHDEQDGRDRISELARAALADSVVASIPCTISSDQSEGEPVRVAECTGEMPLLFVPWSHVRIHVRATALEEPS